MATTNTYNFSLPFDELLDEAMDLVGGVPILAHEFRSARRALDLVMTDMQNRGVALWTVERSLVSVSVSAPTFTAPANTVDLLNLHIRVYGNDLRMERLGYSSWADVPNKTMRGRPSQFFVDRTQNIPFIYLWPVPDQDYTLLMTRQRFTQDTGTAQDVDAPRRMWPALVYGLAYYMGMKRPKMDPGKLSLLKANFEEACKYAMQEDRERTNIQFRPKLT